MKKSCLNQLVIPRTSRIAAAAISLASFCLPSSTIRAQGTAFTYQGQLQNNGSPANGAFNLSFSLYNVSAGGAAISGPLTNAAVIVSNGLFTTLIDFGPGVFTGSNTWLQLGVGTNGTSTFATLTPRQQLTPAPEAIYASSAGLATGVAPSAVIQGQSLDVGTNNSLSGAYATIAGGSGNNANGNYATIAGGIGNTASNTAAVVGGGWANVSSGDHSTVAGGEGNRAMGSHTFIGGGAYNSASNYDVIVGGQNNTISADWSGIGSGDGNNISGLYCLICGGLGNFIIMGTFDAIGGGVDNYILTNSFASTISGGATNIVQSATYGSTIGGGFLNTVASGTGSTVGGGGLNEAGYIQNNGTNNSFTNVYYATVCGGYGNSASGSGSFVGGGAGLEYGNPVPGGNQAGGTSSTIAGGVGNVANGAWSTLGGGESNLAGGDLSFVGGGQGNWIYSSGSVIGGGIANVIDGQNSAIGGGFSNTIEGNYSAVGGGWANSSFADMSTIAGGYYNTANGEFATVGGGYANTASGFGAIVPGGEYNFAQGQFSFAAGQSARALNDGSFVWADDSSSSPVSTTANNQFIIRATGGVQVQAAQAYATFSSSSAANGSVLQLLNTTASPTYLGAINFQNGHTTPGQIGYFPGDDSFRFTRAGVANQMVLNSGGLYVNGTFVSSSDRNAKENFAAVSALEILEKVAALPVTRWNYKQDNTSEHIGPMAQDFYAAFGVGSDDKHITTIDESGIALAAIQGLNQKVVEQLKAKDTEIKDLKESVASLKKLVQSLAEKQ